MVLDAVVTAEDHGTGQTNHFLGFDVQFSLCVGIGIQIEKALDDQVVFGHNSLVHFASVVVEFLN